MAIESELARAGIVVTDDAIILTRDVTFGEDVNVEGDMSVTDDVTVSGDAFVGGDITGTVVGKYYLEIDTLTISGANAVYLVVPTDGAGKISNFRWVVTTAVTIADAELTLSISGGANITQTVTVPFAASAIGVRGTQAFAATLEDITVAAGDNIKILSDAGATVGAIDGFIEITRT